jgi:hypothetical protein
MKIRGLVESNAVMKDTVIDMGSRIRSLEDDNSALKQEVLDVTDQARQNATAAATALTVAVETAVKPYWYTVVGLFTVLCGTIAVMWWSSRAPKKVVSQKQQQQQKQKKSVYDDDADGIESFESNDKKAFESIMTSARSRLYGTYEGSDSD